MEVCVFLASGRMKMADVISFPAIKRTDQIAIDQELRPVGRPEVIIFPGINVGACRARASVKSGGQVLNESDGR
jgi:hypothetical protein